MRLLPRRPGGAGPTGPRPPPGRADRAQGSETEAADDANYSLLHYPTHHEVWFDIVLNDLDGDWYEERNPINLAAAIDIPVYLQIDQGRGWTVDDKTMDEGGAVALVAEAQSVEPSGPSRGEVSFETDLVPSNLVPIAS